MDHHEQADRLEHQADRLEQEADELRGDIESARSDWEAKKSDASVPGATDDAGDEASAASSSCVYETGANE